jgi:mono/diheme cytochrome c family protein
MRSSLPLLACLLLRGLTPPAQAASDPIDYLRDVMPILKEHCYACHGALKQKAKLRLDTAALMRKGGRHGPAVVPGRPGQSRLLARISARDEAERMPPEGKPLSAAQIRLLRRWVEHGATAPADERPEEDPRQHWAFRRPVRPPVPSVKNAAWVRNPIDAFIAAEHAERGLVPAGPADRAVLLRRVYLDLIGLPPTREELHAFLADPAPDAYERVVDRLLASPRHAERWARHWMDVWRYSDWYGSRYINELRNSRRHIWRWRDWLMEALERDKGYDRLILEMLAGDELVPGDRDVQRAGGYLGRNFYVFNRTVWLQDTVEYTAAGLLGLTLKCCRCHDHKYDPLTQEDYYRFRAFFEPYGVRTDPLPGQRRRIKGNIAAGSPPGTELQEGLDGVYDADLKTPTYLLARGDDRYPAKDRPLSPRVPALFAAGAVRVAPVPLPPEVFYPELRPEFLAEKRAAAAAAVRAAEAGVASAKGEPAIRLAEKRLSAARSRAAALEARIAAELSKYTRSNDPQFPKLAQAAKKAEHEANVRQLEANVEQAQQGVAAAPKRLTELQANLAKARKAAADYTPLGPVYPSKSSGRRLALARWIAGTDNPLTARVAVNHVWLRHFGAALVPSVSNFGRNGQRPTHPELLDWLAVEFVENGWSLRHLHRLIVTSNAYRMASAKPPASEAASDPENRYLWRANVRRMEAEVVRDSLLHLAGRLDVARGGPDLEPTKDDVIPRRSLYFRHTPDEKPLILDVFDAANPSECFERTESVVPQQALALANSDFCRAQARAIARTVEARGNDLSDPQFITAAFELVLARPPDAAEQSRCAAFLRKNRRPGSRENLVHVLLNYNEFVTIR